MAALTCDICGGNLEMNESGEFAMCESCGMKHTKERVKVKVQEIRGVVEVTKGEAEKERLLKNAETFISLNEHSKANSIYRQITEDYPDDYRGWFCLAGMVRDELYSQLSTFTQTKDITLKDAESSIYEGGKIASSIIGRLKTIKYYNSKLLVLNKEAADTVTKYEHEFIEKYNSRGLPFMNALSVAIIKSYKGTLECSSVIQEWANTLVRDYILKYDSSEITELFWITDDPEQNDDIYPVAKEFLLRAYKCAMMIDSLPKESQINLMHALGSERPTYADKCIMWTGTNIIFRCGTGYDGYTTVCRTQNVSIKNENDAHRIITSHLTEIEKKLKEANSLMPMNQEAMIKEILTRFTNSKIRESRYKWETNFSYRISRIGVEHFEYTVYYQDGDRSKTENQSAIFSSGFTFDELLMVMRRHSNKCLYCGGSFKGLISRTCKMCGKAKNY